MHGTQASYSTQTTCAAVWAAVFGRRVASSFSSLGRLDKYISGRGVCPLGVNSTRTVLNPNSQSSAGRRQAVPIAVHTCGDEGHKPGLKPAVPAPTGIFIAESFSAAFRQLFLRAISYSFLVSYFDRAEHGSANR